MKEKLMKEIRLNECEVRADEQDEGKMIIEGYPIVFDREAFIEGWDGGFYEKVDRKAFDTADMSDVRWRPRQSERRSSSTRKYPLCCCCHTTRSHMKRTALTPPFTRQGWRRFQNHLPSSAQTSI